MATDLPKLKMTAMLIGVISLLLLLYLISLSGSSFVLNFFGLTAVNGTVLFISRILYWVCLLLLWLYAVKIEKQKLLIWQEKNYKLLRFVLSIVGVLLIIYAGSFCIQQILSLTGFKEKSERLSEMLAIFKANKFLLVFTALTAGVVEELIFRGYVLTRLAIIFKSPVFAIIVSSLLFGALHYKYGTLSNVLVPVFIGLIFSIYYWKYRNIKVLIICHFLIDLISLLSQAK